jgi:thymidine kinase
MITIYTGVMFSGKTEKLLETYQQLQKQNIKTLLVKPKIDNRFSTDEVVSRAGSKAKADLIIDTQRKDNDLEYILYLCKIDDIKAVLFDESQFFPEELVYICQALAEKRIQVYLSGLMYDCNQKIFGSLKRISLLGTWVKVQEFKIFCQKCQVNTAEVSYRVVSDDSQILVGSDQYEPRCKGCL